MKKFSSAFTMIELVFVIVVLGILAGVAIPRLAATREDANIAKMRGDLASIRSGIALKRSENMMRGSIAFPELEGANAATIFENVIQEGIYPNGKNGWKLKSDNANKAVYEACFGKKCTDFTYYKVNENEVDKDGKVIGIKNHAGSFDCDHSKVVCQKLAQ